MDKGEGGTALKRIALAGIVERVLFGRIDFGPDKLDREGDLGAGSQIVIPGEGTTSAAQTGHRHSAVAAGKLRHSVDINLNIKHLGQIFGAGVGVGAAADGAVNRACVFQRPRKVPAVARFHVRDGDVLDIVRAVDAQVQRAGGNFAAQRARVGEDGVGADGKAGDQNHGHDDGEKLVIFDPIFHERIPPFFFPFWVVNVRVVAN